MDGQLHADFGRVAETLRRQLARHPGGGAVCVYHHGEKVVDLWGGERDEWGSPWVEETLAPSFSTTHAASSRSSAAVNTVIGVPSGFSVHIRLSIRAPLFEITACAASMMLAVDR